MFKIFISSVTRRFYLFRWWSHSKFAQRELGSDEESSREDCAVVLYANMSALLTRITRIMLFSARLFNFRSYVTCQDNGTVRPMGKAVLPEILRFYRDQDNLYMNCTVGLGLFQLDSFFN